MTTPSVEAMAAQAALAARRFENALHGRGVWTMVWTGIEVIATRTLSEEGVDIVASFPAMCWLSPPDDRVVLRYNGVDCGSYPIDSPDDKSFVVRWSLRAQVRVLV